MKFKVLFIIFCILYFAFCSGSYAAFEDLGVGARAMGMGGAFVGVSDDASALFYNPAGITQLKRPEVTGTLSWLFPGSADSTYGYLGFVYPTMKTGYFGVSLLGRNISANNGKYGESILGISYARKIDAHVSWGVTIKNCSQGDTYSALPLFFKDRFPGGLNVDLGLTYRIPQLESLILGAGINDIGAGICNVRFGAGYKFDRLFEIFQDSLASSDLVIRGDGDFKLDLGAEGWFTNPKLQEVLKGNLLGVRIGTKIGTAGDFSLGMGVGIKSNNIERTDWKLDLAIVPIYHTSSGLTGGNYSVSYSLLFGDANAWEKEEQVRLKEEEKNAKLLDDLKKLEGLTLTEDQNKIVIVAQEAAIGFVSGSAEILPESYKALDLIVNALQVYSDSVVLIEGYTDNLPIGPRLKAKYPSNLELSRDRAESIAQYFVKQGISEERLVKKGYGEKNPIALNTTEEGRTKNRRVEITIQK